MLEFEHFSYAFSCLILMLRFVSVTKFIDENQLPHLLFYGPPGTGKTSAILACARKLYQAGQFRSMVIFVNSCSRGAFQWLISIYVGFRAKCFRWSWYKYCARSHIEFCLNTYHLQVWIQVDNFRWSWCYDKRCPKCFKKKYVKLYKYVLL